MTPPPFPPRTCPVCGSQKKYPIYNQRFTGLSDVSLMEGYDVVVCSECGVGYADCLPNQHAFDAYYRDLSKYENQHRSKALTDYDRHRFHQTVELLAEAFPDRHLRILEVGCSTGGLLECLQARGYVHLMGLDPSPLCTRLTQERCKIDTLTGSISDLGQSGGLFDIIILGSVVEHLLDMSSALAILKSCLRPSGHLYLEVPDVSRFKEHVQAPFQEFSLEHITYFSIESLVNLLGIHGFELVFAHKATPEPFPGVFAVEIKALFRHNGPPRPLVPDTQTKGALELYVALSRSLERELANTLNRLAESRIPILVWGVGTHTQHLLSTSRLRDLNIQAFLDSNPNYQGHTLQGLPVLDPRNLKERTEPILISSRQFQEEIADQIRNGLGLSNEIIRLY